MRLGASSTGEWPRRICYLESTPPGIRKAVRRKVMRVHRYKGHVGFPPNVAADARPGFSVTAHQAAGILFGQCVGDSRVLVRTEITRTRAHTEGKDGRYDPTRKSGLLSLLRSPDPYRCAGPICGRGVFPAEVAGKFVAGGTWTIGGAILRSAPARAALGIYPHHLGFGGAIAEYPCSSPH